MSDKEKSSMTEKEKMLAGKIYDPSDGELLSLRTKAHLLSKKYNDLPETDDARADILKALIPHCGENVYFQGPVQFDYGCFTSVGDHCYFNFNFTCLDCCPVTIKDNVFFGPNVSLLTPIHPFCHEDRNLYRRADGVMTDREYAKPIVIGSNCWIAGNVTVCGGVTVGEGSVIGAGSVVTRDIPPYSLAAGVPCRVIRPITEKDALEYHPELFLAPSSVPDTAKKIRRFGRFCPWCGAEVRENFLFCDACGKELPQQSS